MCVSISKCNLRYLFAPLLGLLELVAVIHYIPPRPVLDSSASADLQVGESCSVLQMEM